MPSKLVLASASPRRKEILTKIGYQFTTVIADAEESEDESLGLEGLSTFNAELKAKTISNRLNDPEAIIIGSDTVVWLNGKAYGKPQNKQEAYQFLSELSGNTHQVGTGVSILSQNCIETFCEIAEVTFKKLSGQDIKSYIEDIPVMDKAGAYAIQHGGDRIIAKYEGEFETIMGLPYTRLKKALASYNV